MNSNEPEKGIENETIVRHFCTIILSILKNRILGIVLDLLCAVVIPLLTYFQNDFYLICTCIIYVIIKISIFTVLSRDEKLQKKKTSDFMTERDKIKQLEADHNACKKLIQSMVEIDQIAANQILGASELIFSSETISLNAVQAIFGFQRSAFIVCKEMYELLNSYLSSDDCFITVFQRFKKGRKNICKMIAYWNKNDEEPITYQKPYRIRKNISDKAKVEFFLKIFSSEDITIRILPTKKQIQEEFVIHKENGESEERIEQYIGLPIALKNEPIHILLQIDFEHNAFGEDEKDVRKKAEILLYPFAKRLFILYEMSRLIETIANRRERI